MAKAKPITAARSNRIFPEETRGTRGGSRGSLEVTIGDKTFKAWPQGTAFACPEEQRTEDKAAPKLFSTGSCGFMASTKARTRVRAEWHPTRFAVQWWCRSRWRWAVSPLCCSAAGGFGRVWGLRASPRQVV